jgi:hypothetical protein
MRNISLAALAAFALALFASAVFALSSAARDTLALAHGRPPFGTTYLVPKKPVPHLNNSKMPTSLKSSLKTLGTSYEQIVSNPSSLCSLVLCNKSEYESRATIRIRRGGETYTLFGGPLQPGQISYIFKEKAKGVSLEGADVLEASASSSGAVDVACSYEETAGSQRLFNSDSWNNRSSWATARGVSAGTFNPPQFVIDGLEAGASRWRSSACYQKSVYEGVASLAPGWEGLELENYTEINANNGYLASCGVNLYVEDGTLLNAVSFDLQVNLFYSAALTADQWKDVMTHEMGHGLGVGIFWTSSSFFLNAGSYPNVQRAYNSITTLDRNKTPLESSGGGGTASAHWEDDFRSSEGTSYYGTANELMVGALVPGGMILSDLSLGALEDFGYETYPSTEGKPDLSTSASFRAQEGELKCGLSALNPEKMMSMLKPMVVATDGKLTLRRYIIA